MTTRLFFGCALFAALFVIPSTSAAFEVTAQSAIPLTENAALYSLSVDLGYQKYAMTVPVFVTVGQGDMGYVSVAIEPTDAPAGEVRGIILSDAEVRDGAYYIPAGEAARFTLITIVQVANDTTIDAARTMSVTRWPFILHDGDKQIKNGLSTGELTDFVTPAVTF